MNDVKKRKTHEPEYKAKIGLEAVRGAKTIREIAQEYGVHPVQVGQYKKHILSQAGRLFESKRGPKPAGEHHDHMNFFSEIGMSKMDLDFTRNKH